ncbi:MAG TPA: dTDP-4-dehydrorhamnose 3,5-epimerase [Gammaproteobacteria bacterium]|nr:dTDP-4-dehydrorhamnose 3,5-epimerase [Gammaproteobacteria bacterium]
MKLHRLPLAGLTLVETVALRDERGQFTRLFCEQELSGLRPRLHWTQINHSKTSRRGTVRGMHFQYPPAAEAKMIRCLRGRVFDVAVDLRAGSPTFLRWHGVELSEDDAMQFFIPEGFAHGFQTLSEGVELLYLHTASWEPECEGRLRHDDPRLGIRWPLAVSQVSDRDRGAPLLTDQFTGIRL